jgi:hypothetical protein
MSSAVRLEQTTVFHHFKILYLHKILLGANKMIFVFALGQQKPISADTAHFTSVPPIYNSFEVKVDLLRLKMLRGTREKPVKHFEIKILYSSEVPVKVDFLQYIFMLFKAI